MVFKVAYSFGFLGEYDEDDLQSSAPKGFQRDVINMYSQAAFYSYSLISNVVLLNLLIAIIGDSYDRVKGNEAATRGIQRARTLCDLDRVWGNLLTGIDNSHGKPDEFYPKCLHVLTQRTSYGYNAVAEKPTWEGKMANVMSSVSENLKGIIEEQNDQLARRVESKLKQIEVNIDDRFASFETRFREMELKRQNEGVESKSAGGGGRIQPSTAELAQDTVTSLVGPPSRVLSTTVMKLKSKGRSKIEMRTQVIAKSKKSKK